MNLFLSPHNDDEVLFGAFTLMRDSPLVVIVFDGHVQGLRGAPITANQRRSESISALRELGVSPPMFLGYPDTEDRPKSLLASLRHLADRHAPELVYAPAVEANGHAQHNYVGELAKQIFPKVQHYMTYTRTGGKSTGSPVNPEPWMVWRKMRALACYESQITLDNCREHFLRDIREYYAPA